MLEGYIEGKGKEHQSSKGCQSISTLCNLISFCGKGNNWFGIDIEYTIYDEKQYRGPLQNIRVGLP
jgi:hypothetical protein